MSEILRIRTVSSRSKIDTLREFGHRAFVELGDDGKPKGYFIEVREGPGIEASPQRAGRRTSTTPNTALVWVRGKKFACKRPESMYAKIAAAVEAFTDIPVRRAELVEAVQKDSGFTELQVTNAVSRLTVDGYLVIPG